MEQTAVFPKNVPVSLRGELNITLPGAEKDDAVSSPPL